MSDPASTDQPGRSFHGIELPLAARYDLDPVHTFITFRARHLVVGQVDGRFTSFQGSFSVTEDPEVLFDDFEVTFDPSSIFTQAEMRDDDLRGPRYFDIASFPVITLRGGPGRHTEGDRWSLDGKLTIRDVARPVALEVVVRGTMIDAHGKAKAALTVSAAMNRSEFGLTNELTQDSGQPGSGPDVHVTADVEAFRRD
jgi:polyisoprenoid-binding protein YceI